MSAYCYQTKKTWSHLPLIWVIKNDNKTFYGSTEKGKGPPPIPAWSAKWKWGDEGRRTWGDWLVAGRRGGLTPLPIPLPPPTPPFSKKNTPFRLFPFTLNWDKNIFAKPMCVVYWFSPLANPTRPINNTSEIFIDFIFDCHNENLKFLKNESKHSLTMRTFNVLLKS